MKDEDLMQCPLLQGLDAMHRAELLGMLNQSNLRERLEKCLSEHSNTAQALAEPAQVGSNAPKCMEFEKEVHSWNPNVQLWRRGAKE
jgi:hypothetical protein